MMLQVSFAVRSACGARRACGLFGMLAVSFAACAGEPGKTARVPGAGGDAIEANPVVSAPGGSEPASKESAPAAGSDADAASEQENSERAAAAVGASTFRDLDAELTPPVVAANGTPLPQTHDRPHADSA